MKTVLAITFTVMLALIGTPMKSEAAEKPTLEQLRARADSARGEECAEVCLKTAQELAELSNQLFTEGAPDKAHAAMEDAVRYAKRAAEGSLQSRKRQKKTEIALRKLARRITDIGQTLAVDDRPALDEAVDVIEQLRTELLTSMFGHKKGMP